MWATLFSFTNGLAMLCWLVLIFAPRKALLYTLVFYLGMAMLCLIYTAGMAALLSGAIDPFAQEGAGKAGFGSIEAVRALFMSDGGVVIGWTHYLAFDLFVGLWISKDADAKEFSRFIQAPILALTFIAGPVGLFVWLLIRERRARQTAREMGQGRFGK